MRASGCASLGVFALALLGQCACAGTTAATATDGPRPPDATAEDVVASVDVQTRDVATMPEGGADDGPSPADAATRESGTNDVAAPADAPDSRDVPPDDVSDAREALVCGGLALCAGVCRDVQADPRNCGACGAACAPSQECVRGACVMAPCIGGLVACGDQCFDLQTDRSHCGTCACPCPAGTVCSGGSCAAGCPAGLVSCSTPSADGCNNAITCRDLGSDRDHCGGCDRACAPGETCALGLCTPAPPGAVRCAPRPWTPPPTGACDGMGRDACARWAAGRVVTGVASAQCVVPATCVAADRCDRPGDASSCSCGAGPACGPDEVCAAPSASELPRCVCGAA